MKLEQHTDSGSDDSTCYASYTPGPWKADGYHVRQSGQRGTRMIADVCYTGPHHTPPNEYPKSCRIADEANARLIAAAPEMLEALERIREYQGRFDEDDPQSIAADILEKISSANVKVHTPLPARASVETGVKP
jgi:hypothetical protein